MTTLQATGFSRTEIPSLAAASLTGTIAGRVGGFMVRHMFAIQLAAVLASIVWYGIDKM
ncbi:MULTISPECIES: hypothetical protein [unclassified Roseitalea]|uniref:hypothetical protein n=1 Tax=unclassified Roseitalea TaxID=2639107 RepID=UPI00273EE984|nr:MULTISPECIES: hypothetical protein [unclassified Roseitalea]